MTLSLVLGIESSCDDTGLALIDSQKGLIIHQLYSQTKLHNTYGGIVPELASRDHVRIMIPLLRETLNKAGYTKKDLSGIAYTQGPGLLGSLMIGACTAHTLAKTLDIPLIGIHHLEGHLMAVFLEPHPPKFPFTALLVSGGHTLLIAVLAFGHYIILGESRDDAAGEALDKTAKLLGLPYPGGAALSRLAEQGRPKIFHFPRPMIECGGLEFSFSGLKTSAINAYRNSDQSMQTQADIAHAFEEAIVDTLIIKCARALDHTKHRTLVIAGGVSANKPLRERLTHLAAEKNIEIKMPALEFCTDNGAMIAQAGLFRLQAGDRTDPNMIQVKARWPLHTLQM